MRARPRGVRREQAANDTRSTPFSSPRGSGQGVTQHGSGPPNVANQTEFSGTESTGARGNAATCVTLAPETPVLSSADVTAQWRRRPRTGKEAFGRKQR